MKKQIGEVGGPDPMLYDAPLSTRRMFYPLGFSLEVVSNSPDIHRAAQASWGDFRRRFTAPPLRMEIGVHGSGNSRTIMPPVFRGRGQLASIVSDPHNLAVCDMSRGFAYGWFTPELVRDPEFLRFHFFSAMVYNFLLAPRHFTIVHAAFVALDGEGVLLCGDAGAGKSSLAYACARRGWTFLSDDASFLLRRSKDRHVIGNPHLIRFRESAKELFPELRTRLAKRRPSGKMSIELRTADLPGFRTAAECRVSKIVFLNRGANASAELRPYSRRGAFAKLAEVLCYGEPRVRKEQRASLRNLLSAGVQELCYRDLDAAVARLERLVRAGD
jgi:hypothetical protein